MLELALVIVVSIVSFLMGGSLLLSAIITSRSQTKFVNKMDAIEARQKAIANGEDYLALVKD